MNAGALITKRVKAQNARNIGARALKYTYLSSTRMRRVCSSTASR